MRVLDLFCGAGCASDGYKRVGYDVYGVDFKRQRLYPYPFLQHDALAIPVEFLRLFDLIHASPPCQGYTDMNAPGRKVDHPRLIAPTLDLLKRSGVPFVLENVESKAARREMDNPVTLCGSMFNLGSDGYQLRRHRLFKTSFPIWIPECSHRSPVIGIYGDHVRCRAAAHGGRRTRDFEDHDKPALAHRAMRMKRKVTMHDLSEGIPPDYTCFIGAQFWDRQSNVPGRADMLAS